MKNNSLLKDKVEDSSSVVDRGEQNSPLAPKIEKTEVSTPNEEIEKEFENSIYLPKLRESLNELKKELLGKTLDEEDVELISNSYEELIKGIIKQIVPTVQKALSLKEQEDWKLKEDYHKAVIAYGELDEKYRKYLRRWGNENIRII